MSDVSNENPVDTRSERPPTWNEERIKEFLEFTNRKIVVDPILYPNNIIPAGWRPKLYEDFMAEQGFDCIYGEHGQLLRFEKRPRNFNV